MLSKVAVVAGLAASTAAETVHGVVVFSRHGDRTSKYFSGYTMTNLGSQQVYSSGDFYRQRYLANSSEFQIAGISSDRVKPSQIWASAPDQSVLYQTATNFLQGLYPPLGSNSLAVEQLVNGTNTEDPINGYQFILVHGESTEEPDTIWIKGDDECPAWTSASKTYRTSPLYMDRMNSTASFYSQFEPILNPIMGAGNVSFKNAYDVFDLLNVAKIHNTSVAGDISSSALDQARYLANEWEWNMNYNATQPDRSIGGRALAGGFLQRMAAIVKAGGKSAQFNLMAGSYDTFLAFFGLVNATAASADFYGLPNYAATMSFELFSDADNATFPANPDQDLKVRWLFRNGTEPGIDLTAFPLFGQQETALSYGEFTRMLGARAVNSVGQWCSTCGSTAGFCLAANGTTAEGVPAVNQASKGSSLSNAAAGGIGAGVTLAVVAILGGLAFLLTRKKRQGKMQSATVSHEGEKETGSETDSV